MLIWYHPELRTHFRSLSLIGISIKPHLLRLLNCFKSITQWDFIYSHILVQPLFSSVSHYIGLPQFLPLKMYHYWLCVCVRESEFLYLQILKQCWYVIKEMPIILSLHFYFWLMYVLLDIQLFHRREDTIYEYAYPTHRSVVITRRLWNSQSQPLSNIFNVQTDLLSWLVKSYSH